MTSVKTSERLRAELMVRDYLKNVAALAEGEAQALHSTPVRPETPSRAAGRVSDDTGRRAGILAGAQRRRVEDEVNAVRYALSMCRAVPEGSKIERLVRAVYWDDKPRRIYQAAMDMQLSPEWAGKLMKRFFALVGAWFWVE